MEIVRCFRETSVCKNIVLLGECTVEKGRKKSLTKFARLFCVCIALFTKLIYTYSSFNLRGCWGTPLGSYRNKCYKHLNGYETI